MQHPAKMWVGIILFVASLIVLNRFGNLQTVLALAPYILPDNVELHSTQAHRSAHYNPDTPTIIGGEEADPDDWPWMVALVYADNPNAAQGQFCGGALLHERWVLTAAHCTYSLNGTQRATDEIAVVAGRHQLAHEDGVRVRVQQIIRHPDYTGFTFDNDLALLELATPIMAPRLALPTSQPAALETQDTAAVVIGWGITEEGSASSVLRQVEVPLVDLHTCRRSYGIFTEKISNNMICAGRKSGGIDSCQGDSGGPLVVFDRTIADWVQVGIVSWGDGCAEPNYYGVYTRVSNYTAWIGNYIPALTVNTPTATATPTATPTATATPQPATPTSTFIATAPTAMPTTTSTFIPTAPPGLNQTPVATAAPTGQPNSEASGNPTAIPAQVETKIFFPLISNINTNGLNSGSFEAANSSNSSWREFSLQGRPLIQSHTATGLEPHSGQWLAKLGGIRREVAYVYQILTVPAATPVLDYWIFIRSDDDCGYDFGGVVVDDRVVDKFDLCQPTATAQWIQRRVDLRQYAGETVTLEIRAETDRFLDSALFVDDISLISLKAAVNATNFAAAATGPTVTPPQARASDSPKSATND